MTLIPCETDCRVPLSSAVVSANSLVVPFNILKKIPNVVIIMPPAKPSRARVAVSTPCLKNKILRARGTAPMLIA